MGPHATLIIAVAAMARPGALLGHESPLAGSGSGGGGGAWRHQVDDVLRPRGASLQGCVPRAVPTLLMILCHHHAQSELKAIC